MWGGSVCLSPERPSRGRSRFRASSMRPASTCGHPQQGTALEAVTLRARARQRVHRPQALPAAFEAVSADTRVSASPSASVSDKPLITSAIVSSTVWGLIGAHPHLQ